MESKNLLVSLVAILALIFAIAYVSAAETPYITSVEVNGVEALDGSADIGVTAGETLAVKVVFEAVTNASDVKIKAWITGASAYSATSGSFDVVEGRTYSKLFAVKVPTNIDPSEDVYLYLDTEGDNLPIDEIRKIKLTAHRESYKVELLDVILDSSVQAGTNLAMDVVLKNRGSHLAEDTFVRVRIPALGVEERSYFGDLSALDQSDPDKEDAAERRMYVSIPSDAKPGVYVLELEAYNGDSSTVITRKLAIVGSSGESMVVGSSSSKTFAVGEKATYSMTLVNTGNKIKVYDLSVENDNDNLNVDVDESPVVVPAGSSKSVKVTAVAAKSGKYDFAVEVTSGGDVVQKTTLTANVEGTSSGTGAVSGNTAVVLTVILAIIFVVLLVVLIVLLTRKPEKQEIGESYY